MGDGQQGNRTKLLGLERYYQNLDLESWNTPQAYVQVVDQFLQHFNSKQIFISQEGFLPPKA